MFTFSSFMKDVKSIAANSTKYVENVRDEYMLNRMVSKGNHLLDCVKTFIGVISPELALKCKQIKKRRKNAEKEKGKANPEQQQQIQPEQPSIGQTILVDPIQSAPVDVDKDAMIDEQMREQEDRQLASAVAVVSKSATITVSPHTSSEMESSSNNENVVHQQEQLQLPALPQQQQEQPAVEIDEHALHAWLERLVSVTAGYNVEQLDQCFSMIYACLFPFRNTHQRDKLLHSLNQLVDKMNVQQQE